MLAQELVEPSIDWFALTPLLVLLGGGMALLVGGALTPTWPRGCYAAFTVLVAGAAGGVGDVPVGRHHRQGAATLVSAARSPSTRSPSS